MRYYLYLYTNLLDDKKYIGITNNVERRCKQHANGKGGAELFRRAINKYGIDKFSFKVLAILDNVEEANRVEQGAIRVFSTLSPDGYNLNGGSPYTSYNGPFSQETKEKLSKSSMGKVISQEQRLKISVAFKGKPWTDARRAAYSYTPKQKESWENIIHDPDFIKKRDEYNSSPEHLAQLEELRLNTIGIKRSPEICAKISLGRKGKKIKPRSIEHCQKISENKKKWWAERKKENVNV